MGLVLHGNISCSGSDERYHPTPMIGVLGHWLFCHFLPGTDSSEVYCYPNQKGGRYCFKSASSTTSKCRWLKWHNPDAGKILKYLHLLMDLWREQVQK